MTLKNIKVTDNVKQQLDDYALDKETYNVTIQRLINENNLLKARCDELKQDKELLISIRESNNDRVIKHNPILEKNDVDVLLSEGLTEFYRQEYKNFPDSNYSSTPIEIVGFISILNALYEIDTDYDGSYDKHKLFKLIDGLNYCIREYKGKDYSDIDSDESLYSILKCDYRDYDVKDDLLEYLKE